MENSPFSNSPPIGPPLPFSRLIFPSLGETFTVEGRPPSLIFSLVLSLSLFLPLFFLFLNEKEKNEKNVFGQVNSTRGFFCPASFFAGVFRSLDHSAGCGGNLGPEVSTLLSDGAGDGGSLHLTLGVHNDASVVLKVQEDTVPTAPRLPLTHNDCGVH